jgi:hypothetical protein
VGSRRGGGIAVGWGLNLGTRGQWYGCVFEAEPSASLFVDDGQFGASSPAAGVIVVNGLNDYAVSTGVVFETGQADKTRFMVDGATQPTVAAFSLALQHSILGGSPSVVGETVALGGPKGTAPPRDLVRGDAQSANRLIRDDAVRTSLQICGKGAIALRSACAAATQSPWPFLARRFYLARADAKIAYIGPLALADPLFGFRLGSLQSRWALAVLLGRPPGANNLPRSACKQLVADLGWCPLWPAIVASAVGLYMSMRHDAPGFYHTKVASAVQPLQGSWTHAVRRIMSRYSIPEWAPAVDALQVQSRDGQA